MNRSYFIAFAFFFAIASATAQFEFDTPIANNEYCDYATTSYSTDVNTTNATLWLNDVPVNYNDMIENETETYYIAGTDLIFGENSLVLSGTVDPEISNETISFYYTGVCPDKVNTIVSELDYTIFYAFTFLLLLCAVVFGIRLL